MHEEARKDIEYILSLECKMALDTFLENWLSFTPETEDDVAYQAEIIKYVEENKDA